ncbi:aminotransferase class III-fold pyridoxal phosphate-dependent enzyme [Ensifer sesbaniae]|uniref:aminotransferase class III-fold pyridoxal phosphate-dependent enzyme n=1 Tax=Ensifer sesbaniae TaxID=1214071 RepID=UPI0020016F55|nr:aminotransferase class III-fold pyridoxal phosphate-dependent enzyme [Ensifer sesbaniae]
MTGLYERDRAAIATLQKLRFFPLAIAGGRGARVVEENGRELIDLSGAWGAASLGYGHPALVEAISGAAANPAGASVLSAAHGPATALAEKLLAAFPGSGDNKVWFGHSGSDANEAVFRTKATGRSGRPVIFLGCARTPHQNRLWHREDSQSPLDGVQRLLSRHGGCVRATEGNLPRSGDA